MVSSDANLTDAGSDRLLSTLHARGPDYGPVVAYEAGVDFDEAPDHFRALRERGLVERVSEEPCYRVTERGEQVLRDGHIQGAVGSRQTDVA